MALENIGYKAVIENLQGFNAGIAQMQSGVDQFAAQVEKHSDTFKKLGLTLTAMGAAGTLLIRSFVQAGRESQLALNTLGIVVSNTGADWDKYRGQVEAVTLALSLKTQYGDDEQIKALTEMVPILGSVEAALAALPAVLNVATVSGQGLETSSRNVAMALTKQSDTIARTGIEFDKAAGPAERLRILTEKLGGAAEANADPFSKLGNAMSELKETIGKDLIPIITPFIGLLQKTVDWVSQLNPWVLKVGGGLLLAGTAFASILGPAFLFLGFLPGMVKGAEALSAAFGTLASVQFAQIATGFGSILLTAGGLAAALILIGEGALLAKSALDAFKPSVGGFWEGTKTWWHDLWYAKEAPTTAVPEPIPQSNLDKFGEALEKNKQLGIDFAKSLLDVLSPSLGSTGKIGDLLKQTMDDINKAMAGVNVQSKDLTVNVQDLSVAAAETVDPFQEMLFAFYNWAKAAGKGSDLISLGFADMKGQADRLGLTLDEVFRLRIVQAFDQASGSVADFAAKLEGGSEFVAQMDKAGLSLAEQWTILTDAFNSGALSLKSVGDGIKEAQSLMSRFPTVVTPEMALLKVQIDLLASSTEGGTQALKAMQEQGLSLTEQWVLLNYAIAQGPDLLKQIGDSIKKTIPTYEELTMALADLGAKQIQKKQVDDLAASIKNGAFWLDVMTSAGWDAAQMWDYLNEGLTRGNLTFDDTLAKVTAMTEALQRMWAVTSQPTTIEELRSLLSGGGLLTTMAGGEAQKAGGDILSAFNALMTGEKEFYAQLGVPRYEYLRTTQQQQQVTDMLRMIAQLIQAARDAIDASMGGSGQNMGIPWSSVMPSLAGLMPSFAYGGTMGYGGRALVGERGPEVVSLPAGSRVSPVSHSTTYNVTANYSRPQSPQSLRLDLETIRLLAGR